LNLKIFNGELTYDASEIEALQQWIGADEEKRALAIDLFENKILAHHPKKQADYPGSSIYKVLHEA
jgi:hypothetical protein